MCNATRDIMDCMFEAYLEVSAEPDDIPKTSEPVWILGKKYNAIQELNEIRQDIVSRLWFTYRKNFIAIGGSDGYTSDKGWGCMLRCGQMVLGQALLRLHLGRNWQWEPETKDPTYLRILRKFEDNRSAPFSIHQIATTGESEGKVIGQWFGPNTVAQVLRKLLKFDLENSLEIHVAMDNTVVISEIRELCVIEYDDILKVDWKPLLLVVPLRLGLSDINIIYIEGLKKCFQLKQSLGMIGGKPNVALYFIGYVGNEAIYLDPHVTQKSGSVENKQTEEQKEMDLSYHCKLASRMKMVDMDPSLAVCFFCNSEADFIDLCQTIKDQLMDNEKQPLFEIVYQREKEWPVGSSSSTATAAKATTASDMSDQDEFEIL